MKKILLGCMFLSPMAFSEGVFISGGNLSPDTSLACEANFCGQVSTVITIDEDKQPINSSFDSAGEAFFNPNLGGFFFERFVHSLGIAYLDRDETAAKYTESGFYLLTKSFEGNQIPKSDSVTVTALDVDYDFTNNEVTLTFDWSSEISPFTNTLQYGLYMNFEGNLNNELSFWRVEGESRQTFQRRIVVQAKEDLDHLDMHAIIDGQEYNATMQEIYTGFYAWELPPTITDDVDMEVFFNYTLNGVGIDSEVFTANVGDLTEIFNLRFDTFADKVTLTDQVSFPLFSEFGLDTIKLEEAYIIYKYNGGNLQAFKMEREELQNDGFREITGMAYQFPVDLQEGDSIEYSFHYVYRGVPYSTPWEVQEL